MGSVTLACILSTFSSPMVLHTFWNSFGKNPSGFFSSISANVRPVAILSDFWEMCRKSWQNFKFFSSKFWLFMELSDTVFARRALLLRGCCALGFLQGQGRKNSWKWTVLYFRIVNVTVCHWITNLSLFHFKRALYRSDWLLRVTSSLLFCPMWPATDDPIWTLLVLNEGCFSKWNPLV